MMYGLACREEFIHTWYLELRDGLKDFATVVTVDSSTLFFDDDNRIFSPSKNYSIVIDPTIIIEDYEIHVYVVSDGGYLSIWGHFTENKTELDIIILSTKIVDKKVYKEMYVRTTTILEKMKIDDFPVRSPMTVKHKMIYFLVILYLLCILIAWLFNYAYVR